MDRPKLHLICNAHLDPVWQWQWEEGASEALSTFRNAIQLLYENDDLIFNHNEAILYQWVQKYDLGLFREIQNLVNTGRWCISGGWYLQPDVNLPGTESLIRHILEGRWFFSQHFGVKPRVAYNFDSFGHSGGLPQILSLAGYRMYIHMRPQAKELTLPANLYRWRGVNGSEILGYRIEIGLYHTEYGNLKQRLQEGTELALQLNRDVAVFWGIGNHGGGPAREDLHRIDAFRQHENRVEIVHSTPDHFYEAVKDRAKTAPVVQGDVQRVFTGCYTSMSRLKRRAQKSLHQLVQAETLRALTWWTLNQIHPSKELHAAWQGHLFNDFHDILPGSCTQPAEQDALNLYGQVEETVRQLQFGAAVALNRSLQKEFYIPLTVLNANPAITRVPVEVECMISHRPKWEGVWHLRLFTPDGIEIPCQEEQPEALLPFNDWRRKVCFLAELPNVGVAHYYLEAFPGEPKPTSEKSALNFKLDGNTGLISHLFATKKTNCLHGHLLKPLVVEDTGDAWGTDCWSYRNVLTEFKADLETVRVVESGPIRTTYHMIYRYGNSRIVLNTIIYVNFPVLEFRFRVHWNEERKRLKLSIPTAFTSDQLECEVPGGVISRPADGEEHVHSRWLMVHHHFKEQDVALAVVNSGQHGFDFKNGEIRLSVLRSAAYCHQHSLNLDTLSASPKYMDQGVHEFRLLVTAGETKSVRNRLPGLADWLSNPPAAYAHLPFGSVTKTDIQRKSAYPIKNSNELLAIKPETVRLLACKQSRDGQALILRLQNMTGTITPADVRMNYRQMEAHLSFQPLEIKTLRFEKTGRWREVNIVRET